MDIKEKRKLIWASRHDFGTNHIHTNVYFNPFISASQVIGQEGQGVYVLMSGLDIERGVVASMPVG